MNREFATRCLIVGSLLAPLAPLAPLAAHAADSDMDRSRPMTFVKDSAITTKVKAKLAAEKISSLTRIKVDTDQNGVVFLSGRVRTQEEADKAVAITRATDGVTSVNSTLQIRKDD